ncbi:MAG: TolC family protein [Planctomycetes bacterium]|nr:TolC family protein [Planctomycetota bacterium]
MDQKLHAVVLLTLAVFSGCATGSLRNASRLKATTYTVKRTPAAERERPSSTTQLVAHQHETALSHDDVELIPSPMTAVEQHSTWSLEALEAMALSSNPTLVQAAAQVRAARGGAYQAGLLPNPVVGYTSDQLGVNGTAGEFQGGFISQEIVTGGKLRLSRQKWCQRARIAEINRTAQYNRVLNDVRVHFYKTLATQQLVETHTQLVENAEDNVQTHREMLNLGQTNQAGLLQAEVDLQRTRLGLQAVENDLEQSWRNLAAMVGTPQLSRSTLRGSLDPQNSPLDWDSALNRLLENSPELIAAWEKIRHDEITVRRERVEPIPNILVDVSVGHNYETGDTVTGVTAGIPLPIFDKNRGTIQQATADLNRSRADVKRLELALSTQLAAQFRNYQTSWQHVQAYQNEMLPKAKKANDLLHEGYEARRAAWPDVLLAQRIYLDLQTQYIGSLMEYREMDISIRGLLLTGGLSEPPAPVSGGHIDAVPKPR